ncbi:CASKIN [Salix viminalis]|uniref:CASKIN n=1 Tax=Salix viminalis TaxID=40686 RepID=A0A9Q0ZDY6_SALVM|nr:CASKIN [Salix viminalis]
MDVDTSQNEQELEEATTSSLFEYVMGGEWDKVKEIYTREPAAHCAKITTSSDTALHLAVIDGEYDIAEQLVNLMSLEEARKALVVKNELGNTPLHVAAFVGNARLCGCIASKVYKINTVKKNQNSENEEVKSDQNTSNEIEAERDILVEEIEEEREYILLVECNEENEAPLFVAVAQGKTDAFLCLHSYALPKQHISYYRGNKGDTILHVAVSGEYFGENIWREDLQPSEVATAFVLTTASYTTIKRVWDKESRMQSDSTNRPSQNRNNHRCPDNYETCFHFLTLARAFFTEEGR